MRQNWVQDFHQIEIDPIELTETERPAILELIDSLETEQDAEAIQQTIFQTARDNSIKPRTFFQLLYRILLGQPSGPRLGPYIETLGPTRTAEILKKCI
jgi:lysyl-tRNA synthetase class 1